MYPSVHCSTIYNSQGIDEWIKKLWYICTVEYYSAIKKNEFESLLVKWMSLLFRMK